MISVDEGCVELVRRWANYGMHKSREVSKWPALAKLNNNSDEARWQDRKRKDASRQ